MKTFRNVYLICIYLLLTCPIVLLGQDFVKIAPKTVTGYIKNVSSYSKQSGDFFIGYDNGKIGRGLMMFDFANFTASKEIVGIQLSVYAKANFDSNYDGNFIVKKVDIADESANAVVWNMLGIGDNVITGNIPDQGTGWVFPNTTNLLSYVKDAIEKKSTLYLAVSHKSESSKIMRIGASNSDLYINILYKSESTGGGSVSNDRGPCTLKLENVSTTQVTVSWSGGERYYAYIVKDSNGKEVTRVSRDKKSHTFTNLATDTRYTYTFTGTYGMGRDADESSSITFTTRPLIPSQPRNVKAVYNTSTKFCEIIFDPSTSSTQYHDIQYTVYQLKYPFDGTIIANYGTTGLHGKYAHLITSSLNPGQTYAFGVTAKNISGESNWEAVVITIPTTTPTPTVEAPGNVNIRETSGQKILNWTHSGNNITGFIVTDLNSSSRPEYVLSASARSYNLTSLITKPGTYMYYVTAINGSNKSKNVGTGINISSSMSILDELMDEISVSVQENELLVGAVYNDIYNINIYDLSGRMVMSKSVRGNRIDISTLKKGAYIIHLNMDDKVTVKRILKN